MNSWGLLLKLSMKSLSVLSWLMYSIVSWIWNIYVCIYHECFKPIPPGTLEAKPSFPERRFPAGCWRRTGSCSSGSSEGRPPPRRCRSRRFSSGLWGPRWHTGEKWLRTTGRFQFCLTKCFQKYLRVVFNVYLLTKVKK